jgi:hypothetical protein
MGHITVWAPSPGNRSRSSHPLDRSNCIFLIYNGIGYHWTIFSGSPLFLSLLGYNSDFSWLEYEWELWYFTHMEGQALSMLKRERSVKCGKLHEWEWEKMRCWRTKRFFFFFFFFFFSSRRYNFNSLNVLALSPSHLQGLDVRNRHRVPKRRFTKIWRRGVTQKNTHNIQHTAKVWNQKVGLFDWYKLILYVHVTVLHGNKIPYKKRKHMFYLR